MTTSIHCINLDFSHSSEPIELLVIVNKQISRLKPNAHELAFLIKVQKQLKEAVECLECIES